jgi:hypothetical protein
LKIELDGEGHTLRLKEVAIVMKSQAAGSVTIDIYRRGKATADFTKTLTMVNADADYKGHRFKTGDIYGDHLTVRIRNNTASQPVYLLEYGFDMDRSENGVAYDH